MNFNFFKTSHKRTLFLAILATVTFVASAIYMFDVDKGDLLEFFVISVVGLFILIIAALALSGLIVLFKRIFGG